MGQSRLKNTREQTEGQSMCNISQTINKCKDKVFNFLVNKTMQSKTTIPDRIGTDSSLVIQHHKRGAGIPISGIQNAYRDGCPS